MKLKVTGELASTGKSSSDTRGTEAQQRRAVLHAFANLLRGMADRMANAEATHGEFNANGVKGKFEIEE